MVCSTTFSMVVPPCGQILVDLRNCVAAVGDPVVGLVTSWDGAVQGHQLGGCSGEEVVGRLRAMVMMWVVLAVHLNIYTQLKYHNY